MYDPSMRVLTVLELYPQNLIGWARDTLHTSRLENDPAQQAFEALRELILNADRNNGVYSVRHERIAHEMKEWYILPKSKPVIDVLEKYGGLQGLGSQWVQRGWVIPDHAGNSTARKRFNGAQQRVILIPNDVMENGTEGSEVVEKKVEINPPTLF